MRILSGMGMRPVIGRLQPLLQEAVGQPLDCQFEIAGHIHGRILAGEPADLVLLPHSLLADLLARGRVQGDTVTPLAQPLLAAFVPAGAPHPDVGTVAALCASLLQAPAIAITDPASGGISGTAMARILAELRLADLLAPRIMLGTPGRQPTALVAAGAAALGIVQLSEVLAAPGIELVGVLPDVLQPDDPVCAAVPAQAAAGHAARACIAALRAPAAQQALIESGLRPPAAIPRS